jgi:hypothetical protein
MQVSSEPPLATENIPSVLFADGAQAAEELYVEDEEFPSDLPLKYDRMLQLGSQRATRRVLGIIAAVVAALVLFVSGYLLHKLSGSSSSVLASPSSSEQ